MGSPPQYMNVIADINMPTPPSENRVIHVVFRDFDFAGSVSFLCLSINTNAAMSMANDPATIRKMPIFLFAPHAPTRATFELFNGSIAEQESVNYCYNAYYYSALMKKNQTK